ANRRMEDELNVGHDIQMSMVPLDFPPFPDHDEFSIFATLQPAPEVEGDFFDYFIIGDCLYFCVGDVSGKGVPAALFMAVTRTLVRAYASTDRSPASVLTRVNEELSRNNPSCMFVTIFLGIMDLRSRRLRYTNAGHNPPYHVRQHSVEPFSGRHGPVLGAKAGLNYEETQCLMRTGDALVAFTDGVTEATSADDELLGEVRLKTSLQRSAASPVKELVDCVMRLVADFELGTDQADDVTVLALRLNRSEARGDRRETILLENEPSALQAAVEAVDDFCRRHRVDIAVNRRLNVVLDDLLANVIAYGFIDGQKHEIELALEMNGEWVKAQVSDDAVRFDLLAAGRPDTSVSLEERDFGGLGIELIRGLSDEVGYERRGNRNIVTVGFRLRGG
ncbi:MAG: SpoIIE family protein phosphatase, partial [Thiohalocapsa sp.]